MCHRKGKHPLYGQTSHIRAYYIKRGRLEVGKLNYRDAPG